MAYIRRWREDLRGKRAESLFANHVSNGVIEELTNGKFNEVFYVSGKWFLSSYDPENKKRVPDNVPFCFGFCLSEQKQKKNKETKSLFVLVATFWSI